MPVRPQVQYNIKSNNNCLEVAPTVQQNEALIAFCHRFSQIQADFQALSYRIAPDAALSSLVQLQTSHALELLMKEIREEGYCFFDTISDFTTSYKGYIGLIIIGFNNRGYLVDALTLRNELAQLKAIIEDDSITKYCYRLCVVLQDVKREWSAFGRNFYDFQLLEKSIVSKKHQWQSISRVSQRPINSMLLQQLQQRYDIVVKYLAQIRYFLQKEQENQSYSIFSYSNHYDLLRKEYRHQIYTFEEEKREYEMIKEETERRLREDKQNNFLNQNKREDCQYQPTFPILDRRQEYICEYLLHWRQHMAKIYDLPSRRVLNYHQIVLIATQKPTSILEIQNIIGNTVQSLEIAPKLLQLLAYQAEISQNAQNKLDIKTMKRRQDKSVKNLLAELKYEGREEWLNRKNDESIKLYKEIVSIVELDSSVVEEFTDGMHQGIVSNRQIGRFVKYAEYLRNGNHNRLKDFYESTMDLDCGQTDEQLGGWQSEDEEFIVTGKKISKSQTSIASSCQKINDKAELHTLPTIRSPNSFSSLLEVENRVQPLPENIQEIYLKAASVKKTYQKVNKKKGGRKERDENQEFVPTFEEMKMLLEA